MAIYTTSKTIARLFPIADLSGLATSNPGNGKPWNNSGFLSVGAASAPAVDSAVVHLAGAEVLSGLKTVSAGLLLGNVASGAFLDAIPAGGLRVRNWGNTAYGPLEASNVTASGAMLAGADNDSKTHRLSNLYAVSGNDNSVTLTSLQNAGSPINVNSTFVVKQGLFFTSNLAGNVKLKNSGTTLQVKTSDELADAAITAGAATFSGQLTVPLDTYIKAGSFDRIYFANGGQVLHKGASYQFRNTSDTTILNLDGTTLAATLNGNLSLPNASNSSITNSTGALILDGGTDASYFNTNSVIIRTGGLTTNYSRFTSSASGVALTFQFGANNGYFQYDGTTALTNNKAGGEINLRTNNGGTAIVDQVATSGYGYLKAGAATFAGDAKLTGTYPSYLIQPSGWAGTSFYFQAGVNVSATGTGSYTAFVNPDATKGFSWIQGNPNTTGRYVLVANASTGNLLVGTATDDATNKLQVAGPISATSTVDANPLWTGKNAAGTLTSSITGAGDLYLGGSQASFGGGSSGGAGALVYTKGSSGAVLQSYGSKPLIINSVGNNVLIGTATDDATNRLQVSGSGAFTPTGATPALTLKAGTGSDILYAKNLSNTLVMDWGADGSGNARTRLRDSLSNTAIELNASTPHIALSVSGVEVGRYTATSAGVAGWSTGYAGTYSFASTQSGQYMSLLCKTYEGKTGGFTHYDVSHANGRLLDIIASPGVAIRISPNATSSVQFGTDGKAAFNYDVSLAAGKQVTTPFLSVTARAFFGNATNGFVLKTTSGQVMNVYNYGETDYADLYAKAPTFSGDVTVSTGNIKTASGGWMTLLGGTSNLFGVRGSGYDGLMFNGLRLGFDAAATGIADTYVGRYAASTLGVYAERTGVGSTLGKIVSSSIGLGTAPTVYSGWTNGRVLHVYDATANLPHVHLQSTLYHALFGLDGSGIHLETGCTALGFKLNGSDARIYCPVSQRFQDMVWDSTLAAWQETTRRQASASGPMWGAFGNGAVQQTGGVMTAGAAYGANEQTMLQTLWNAMRTYGLLT